MKGTKQMVSILNLIIILISIFSIIIILRNRNINRNRKLISIFMICLYNIYIIYIFSVYSYISYHYNSLQTDAIMEISYDQIYCKRILKLLHQLAMLIFIVIITKKNSKMYDKNS